ncbi:MAG TPA: hypothetical protein VF682_15900 [Pseudomonas sp.]|jgi:hypothetical protein
MKSDGLTFKDPIDQFESDFGLTRRQFLWIWQRLKSRLDLKDGEYASSAQLKLISEKLESARNAQGLRDEMKIDLLPPKRFDWIKNSTRQILWIEKKLRMEPAPPVPLPPQVAARDSLIAQIDYLNKGVEKSEWLSHLERTWHNQLQEDSIFQWFEDKSEKEKCALAWEWMIKNKPFLTDGQRPFRNHADLVLFFESSNTTLDEKKLYVNTVKKRWTQKKYREQTSTQKQHNFILAAQSGESLAALARKHKMTKSSVIEALIDGEARVGSYLSAALPVKG